ncbi:MAG: thioredoxin domain-containing protein [Proteobacteria bacterium]|nr:thioredoxin domain-containing protein [Pseudomonadota bacterium]
MLVLLCFIFALLTHQGIAQTSPESKKSDEQVASKESEKSQEHDNKKLVKIQGKVYTQSDFKKLFPGSYFELEKQAYQAMMLSVQKIFFKNVYEKWAKDNKVDLKNAEKEYLQKMVSVSDKEVNFVFEQYKNEPRFQGMSDKEIKDDIRKLLRSQAEQNHQREVLFKAMNSGDIEVFQSEPVEPRYSIGMFKNEYERYGPKLDDVRPIECKDDGCPITVVEFSEFQCPYCARVLPTTNKILEQYKGKIRWIVRDFPLDFHDRAVPAAVVAGCAHNQGKYWEMYEKLFSDTRGLTEENFVKYAKSIGIYNSKFKDCLAKPDKMIAKIERNKQSGMDLEVQGTPNFFINGQRFSLGPSASSFQQAIDKELARLQKKEK